MSRRVYEVAWELGLSPKEVMGRLNDAGVETESYFSVVEDSAYERVFGDGPRSNGSGGATPKGRPEAREAKASPRRTRSPRTRSRALRRAVVYVLVAALAFVLAAGVGAVVALVLREDTATPVQEGPRQPEQQGDAQQARELDVAPEGGGGADRAHQEEADAAQVEDAPQQEGGVSRLGEAEYLSRVGDIQSETVETFMDSHNKLLRYDALTAQDIDEMRANEAAVEKMAREANDLAPPRNYEEQHEVFGSAVTGLHEAARMAYGLANDPVEAAEIGFDGYDARVNHVARLLERSNEMLGRDYETVGDPREISPPLSATEPARGSEEAAQT